MAIFPSCAHHQTTTKSEYGLMHVRSAFNTFPNQPEVWISFPYTAHKFFGQLAFIQGWFSWISDSSILGTTNETHKSPHDGEKWWWIPQYNPKKNNQKKQIPSLSHVFGIHLKVLKACIQTSEIFGNKKHAWMLQIHQETTYMHTCTHVRDPKQHENATWTC